MELGWWPQLGLAFLQLLLISSLPRGTVGRIQDPPGGDFCLLGLVRGQERGVPREGAVCLWAVVVSFLLVEILGVWLVVLKCPSF